MESGGEAGGRGEGGFSVTVQYYNKLLLRNGLALISW